MAKFKLETFTTPVAVSRMVFLNKPSTKFNVDGTYSVKLVFDPADMAEHIARWDAKIEARIAEEIKKDPKVKKLIKPAKPYAADLDDEGDETGKIVVNFKRHAKTKLEDGTVKTNKVKLIDTDGNPITDSVWSGSKIAVRFFETPYYIAKDKEVGVSLKVTHAMVVDLVSGDGDGFDDPERLGFGKVEGGYKAKAKAAAEEGDEASEDAEASADF